MSQVYIPAEIRRRVAEEARYRCGYYLTLQTIIGQTPVGRATVVALRLNNEYVVPSRRVWIAAGWHPPAD
jgi:hypothetical protein